MAKTYTYLANRVIDTNGISDGASIYIYQTGTTTPVSIYSDAGLTIPVSNPYVVAAGAAVPALYYNYSGNIRVKIINHSGGTISDDDPYNRPATIGELSANSGAATIGTNNGTSVQAVLDVLSAEGAAGYWDGVEYLSTFRTPLSQGNGATVVLSGDSTITGSAITDAGFIPDVLLKTIAADYGADYLVVNNRGQSGKTTVDWINTYLAGDVAITANLYVFHWGQNDPDTALTHLTAAQSLANWETALASFRASKPLSAASCVIMMPNAGVGRGRTAAWFAELSEGLRSIARSYQCAFFDTYNFARDALANIGIGWDNTFGDGTTAVHPLNPLQGMIWAELAEKLFYGLGPDKTNHVWNRRGATGLEANVTDLPAVFPYGITVDRGYASKGWPEDGFAVTIKNSFSQTNALQLFWGASGFQTRIGSGSVWTSWQSTSSTTTTYTLGTNWGYFSGTGSARKVGNTVSLTGILAPAGGATTACFTLPSSCRPVGRSTHLMAITNSGPLHFSISPTTGIATLDSVPGSWISLEGISFEINQ